jgi:hypothetical protein
VWGAQGELKQTAVTVFHEAADAPRFQKENLGKTYFLHIGITFTS